MLIIPNERQASPANNDSPLKANIDKKDAEKDRERERESDREDTVRSNRYVILRRGNTGEAKQ